MPIKDAIEILWENDDAIAVAKPAGLATIPGRDEPDSVLHILAAQIGLPAGGTADPRLRVVHRLDKQTSGGCLFAKHAEGQRHLSHQFQNNTVRKEYLALVSGRPSEQEGEIDAPLARHPASPTRMAIAKHGGRPACTLWKVEETFRQFTLLLHLSQDRQDTSDPSAIWNRSDCRWRLTPSTTPKRRASRPDYFSVSSSRPIDRLAAKKNGR